MRETPSTVVVTPVFEDADAAAMLVDRLAAVLGEEAHVVAVDDGSVHHPLGTDAIGKAGLAGTILRLKRNVGHQRAIAIGLNYVAEHFDKAAEIIVMDSDGEDPPEAIPSLLATLDRESCDVVVASRKNRSESLVFRAFYVVYKVLFWLLTGRAINFGNFVVMKPQALARLVAMNEIWIHLAASVLSSKLRMAQIPIDRSVRLAGRSKLGFTGLAMHGFRGLMVFAEDVLVRVGVACTMVALLSLLGGVVSVALKLLGFATPGWFSVALGILLLVFLQTGALTLMTLMLSGVMRGAVSPSVDYNSFIDRVDKVSVGQTVN